MAKNTLENKSLLKSMKEAKKQRVKNIMKNGENHYNKSLLIDLKNLKGKNYISLNYCRHLTASNDN